jgi:hypothetical protein
MRDANLRTCGEPTRLVCGCERPSIWTWMLSTVIGIFGGAVIAAFIAWALLTIALPW